MFVESIFKSALAAISSRQSQSAIMQAVQTNKVNKNLTADGWLGMLSQWLFDHQTGTLSSGEITMSLAGAELAYLVSYLVLTARRIQRTALAFNTIVPLFLAHIYVPTARPHTSKLFHLSYHNSDTGHYGAGHDDLYLVALFVVLCIGIRAALPG